MEPVTTYDITTILNSDGKSVGGSITNVTDITTTFALTGNPGAPGTPGTPGAPGKNGSTWYEGTGAPPSTLGVLTDYYLNTATGDVYTKTLIGWSLITNITGPGVPTGGSTNQALFKNSGTNFDDTWRAIAESDVTNLSSDLAARAIDSTVVHKTGNETVAGIKTFTSAPVVPSNSFPESAITNLASDIAALVPKTTTVNGHALSSNVTVTSTDVGLGNVTNDAQLKASQLDTDGTLSADSDSRVSSQRATKTYVDAETSRAETAEALLAPKASPALTGTPTAPTAANGTNTTQIATTAFVEAQLPTSLPPNGAAGGDLGGSYPNPLSKARTYSAVVGTTGTVADYVCSGTADDVQIQAAINAVATAGGGVVFIRRGTYRISATITFPKDANVYIVGEKWAKQGSGGSILKASATLTDMFNISGNANPTTNADLSHDNGFKEIVFDGNSETTNLITLSNTDTVKFEHVRMILATNSINTVWNSSVDPVAATIPGGIFLRDSIISANSGIGINLQYQTQCWISDCWFSGSSVTIWIKYQSCNKIHLQNCEFDSATQALYFADTSTIATNDITVSSCTFTMTSGNKAWTEARTSAGSARVYITGTITSGVTHDPLVGSGNFVTLSDGVQPFTLQTQSATDKALILKGVASQSGRYIDVQNSSSTSIAFLNNGGNWYTNNGSTSAVAYGFTNEINTGMYRPTTSELGFSVSGTQKLQLDASGAVGVFSQKISSLASGIANTDATNVGQVLFTPTAVQTSAYAASPSDFVPVDASSASVTITLPTAPADKSRVAVKMVITASSNTVTINTGGSDVFNKTGGGTSLTLSLLFQGVILQYSASTSIWYVQADDLPLSQLDARYQAIGATAGGDLTGTYPNPTLAAAGTAGTYGSSSAIPVITTDSKGRVTSVTTASPASGPPSGAAGGDLGSTYPNPTVTATHLASALPVAQGGTGVATSTGTTNVVLSNSPTVVTPTIMQLNDTNGKEWIGAVATASAVNFISVTNAATGTPPVIASSGSDTNVGLTYKTQGTGTHLFQPGSDTTTALQVKNAAASITSLNVDTTNTRVGIGTASPTSTLFIAGSFGQNRTTVADANFAATSTNCIIAYTSLTAGRTVTLPTAAAITGREYTIKDETGGAATNNITVATTSSQTIDGASTKVISANYGVLRVYSNGANWFTY